ncbi:Zinc finger protein MAGPIE, partial [Cucurbita argyrosperma subsp. sororia]
MKKNSILFSVTIVFLSSCLLVLLYGNLAEDHGNLSSPNSVDHQELEQNNQHHLLDHFRQKKCNRPDNPDPNAEIVVLSPTTLMTTNRFVCELCNKGFQRDQNLQLHRRGHNLPWKPPQRTDVEVKKRVYVCLEPTCIPHNPTRALGEEMEM